MKGSYLIHINIRSRKFSYHWYAKRRKNIRFLDKYTSHGIKNTVESGLAGFEYSLAAYCNESSVCWRYNGDSLIDAQTSHRRFLNAPRHNRSPLLWIGIARRARRISQNSKSMNETRQGTEAKQHAPHPRRFDLWCLIFWLNYKLHLHNLTSNE